MQMYTEERHVTYEIAVPRSSRHVPAVQHHSCAPKRLHLGTAPRTRRVPRRLPRGTRSPRDAPSRRSRRHSAAPVRVAAWPDSPRRSPTPAPATPASVGGKCKPWSTRYTTLNMPSQTRSRSRSLSVTRRTRKPATKRTTKRKRAPSSMNKRRKKSTTTRKIKVTSYHRGRNTARKSGKTKQQTNKRRKSTRR